jgi:hypothetical protein
MADDEIKFADIKNVEIFGLGTWTGSKKTVVTSTMLDQMVAAFAQLSDKVAGFRPPIKLGHSDAQRFMGQDKGGPALGWVSALRRVGDKVVADFADVPASLVDLIRRRLYNSVSIELMPKLEYQGSVFENVLSAVAVLGAELPAVKGLKELSASLFDATTERIVLSEQEQGHQMADATYNQTQLDALIEAAVIKARATFETAQATKLADMTAQITAALAAKTVAETALKTAVDASVQFAADQAKASVEAVVDQAIKQGLLLPKDKAATVAFAQTLDAATKIKFGEKDECTPFERWKGQLLAGKKVVSFTEKTIAGGGTDDDKAADIDVNERATQKVNAAGGPTKLDFATAVNIVLAEDPALKARYAALT